MVQKMNKPHQVKSYKIEEVFDDIIMGRGVKRSVHDLILDDRDYSDLFKIRLIENGFLPKPLKEIAINIGVRMPGFLIQDSTAYFGHLFWEVFSEMKKRLIWGSVLRNEKGDWKYILSGKGPGIVYINSLKIQDIDIFHLT
jgi:hypothetical protein